MNIVSDRPKLPAPPAITGSYYTETNASVFDCTFENLNRGDTEYELEWMVDQVIIRRTTLNSTGRGDFLTEEEFFQANGTFGSQVCILSHRDLSKCYDCCFPFPMGDLRFEFGHDKLTVG